MALSSEALMDTAWWEWEIEIDRVATLRDTLGHLVIWQKPIRDLVEDEQMIIGMLLLLLLLPNWENLTGEATINDISMLVLKVFGVVDKIWKR